MLRDVISSVACSYVVYRIFFKSFLYLLEHTCVPPISQLCFILLNYFLNLCCSFMLPVFLICLMILDCPGKMVRVANLFYSTEV